MAKNYYYSAKEQQRDDSEYHNVINIEQRVPQPLAQMPLPSYMVINKQINSQTLYRKWGTLEHSFLKECLYQILPLRLWDLCGRRSLQKDCKTQWLQVNPKKQYFQDTTRLITYELTKIKRAHTRSIQVKNKTKPSASYLKLFT